MTDAQDRLVSSLSGVAREGALRAGRGLSGLMGQEVTIHVPALRFGTKSDACDAVGGSEALVMGAYLTIGGDVTGHVMLFFPVDRAFACIDLMCGQAPGSTTQVDDLAASAMAELGNVVGSAFVNALADHMNLVLHPSPPAVVHDMAIALVESVYAEVLAQGGEVVMIDTVFEDGAGNVAGLLIVAPDSVALPRLQELAA